MEPLKPETVQDVFKLAGPAAAPGLQDDLEEYERLLSERFTRDPDLPMSPQQAHDVDLAEDRIETLHKKIFRNSLSNSPGRAKATP
jgi:hypothetical protein